MKAVFHTEDLNSYGFWIKLSGLKLDRFKKNPVLLYDHDSSRPAVGKINNLHVEKGQLVGEVEFDEGDELGGELKRKYEKRYMSGFSIGVYPLKFSEAKEDLKPGQTLATVTEAELFEISAVNLPSNQNAVVLYDREAVKLNANQAQQIIPEIKNRETMGNVKLFQTLAMTLALAEGATEQQILEAVQALQQDKEQNEKRVKELSEQLQETIIKFGQERGVITDETREYFEKLAAESPEIALGLIEKTKVVKGATDTELLSTQIERQTPERKAAKKWDELSEQELLELREKHPEQYRKLYYEYYGFEPEMV